MTPQSEYEKAFADACESAECIGYVSDGVHATLAACKHHDPTIMFDSGIAHRNAVLAHGILEAMEVNLKILRNTYGELDGEKVAGARWMSEVIKDYIAALNEKEEGK